MPNRRYRPHGGKSTRSEQQKVGNRFAERKHGFSEEPAMAELKQVPALSAECVKRMKARAIRDDRGQ
jgi:hypothetical protein